jgi:signal transduction histidine kinase/DNA-binding response OmpR family regulator
LKALLPQPLRSAVEPTMRLTVTRRIELSVAIVVALFLLVASVAYRNTKALIQRDYWVSHTHLVLQHIAALDRDSSLLEEAELAYVISADRSHIGEYDSAATDAADQLRSLRSLTADNATQQHRLDVLIPLMRLREQRLRAAMVAPAAGPLDRSSLISGAALNGRIEPILSQMKRTEEILQAQRDSSAANAARWSIETITFAALFALVFIALAGLGLIRGIARPINQLLQQTNIIAAGNYDRPMHLGSGGEFSGLAAGLNDMAARLQAHEAGIAAANAELHRTNRLKSEFLASMSHELRTPLSAIIGFTELMQEANDPLTEKQRRHLGLVSSAARHLLQLINDILDLSKIEAGRTDLRPEEFMLADALDEVLPTVRPMAMQKNIEITVKGSMQRGVFADRLRVKQILYNLLSNAVKFTVEGGSIRVTSAPADRQVAVSVEDNGVGISDEDQKVVFDEFRQVGPTSKGVREGTGLGLAITRRLVEMSGGAISVRSRVGEGSRFTFTLPAAAPTVAASVMTATVGALPAAMPNGASVSGSSAAAAGHASQPGGDIAAEVAAASSTAARPLRHPSAPARERRLVLVVDDDPASRELLSGYLQTAGYQVAFAETGEQALAAAVELSPDAITLDILMPGENGFGILHKLRRTAATMNIPIIVVTVVDNRGGALALGADEYLLKPIDRKTLLDVLARHVRPRSSDDQERPAVLVVDDDPAVLRLVSAMLADRFEIWTADDGSDALERLQAHTFDALVLDLLLPRMSGFELLRRIRSDLRHRATPVVVLTSMDLSSAELEGLRLQDCSVFAKQSDWKRHFLAEIERAVRPTPDA